MRRFLLLAAVVLLPLTGCEEDKSAMALKNTGGVVSRVDNRTTLTYAHMKDCDKKLKRMNFQLGGTFIRIGHLELNTCDASDLGIKELTRITDLEVLHIIECPHMTNESMKLLWQNPKLVDLVVTHTQADDSGFSGLHNLQNLKTLQIGGIADKALFQIGQLKNLERLTIVDSKINEAGARSLSRMQNLRVLDFYRCEMSENVEQQVRKGLPQTRITIDRRGR